CCPDTVPLRPYAPLLWAREESDPLIAGQVVTQLSGPAISVLVDSLAADPSLSDSTFEAGGRWVLMVGALDSSGQPLLYEKVIDRSNLDRFGRILGSIASSNPSFGQSVERLRCSFGLSFGQVGTEVTGQCRITTTDVRKSRGSGEYVVIVRVLNQGSVLDGPLRAVLVLPEDCTLL